ncbi:cystathionine gamma-synthase family protein [Psychrosphaera sp. B3R10]|uniref:cystathionine gamma-synthase family protein n=1 Tax=unclassified Psychrosphaera TaxID=2641570 RepID=UPI001C0A2A03|nr:MULTISPECIES: cystathionine gamma-synthase family protein [unclassified Psychrosphaera]MBU2883272.1 cystathionine gamma-synthase family protein [Psychrosphaera sp. I2R16]MBU2990634.1 cystathionine gamma-synthase family protein [Psychrosphaera sp. B3R10]
MSKGFTTDTVHHDRLLNPDSGAVHYPIVNSVLFGYDNPQDLVDIFQGKQAGHAYARQSTPTTDALQSLITQMEGGTSSLVFASGMAAISTLFFTLLKAGDHVVASRFLFGNTPSLLNTFKRFGIEATLVDVTDVALVEAEIKDNTKFVFTETIANPVTQIADLSAIGALCKKRNIPFVVDNTMTPSYLFKAKEVGASLITCSLTKYVSGHGTVTAGAVIETGQYNWQDFSNILDSFRHLKSEAQVMTQIKKKGLRDFGACLSSDSAQMIAVGAETMALRMDRACSNALALAEYLAQHPKIAKVYYPGLAGHPQHELAKKHFKHFGAIVSFDPVADIDPVKLLSELTTVISATHLGDNRTLALPVAQTIFWEMGIENRQRAGISENMIRMSVGIEDEKDLIADFSNALTNC